MFEYLTVVSIVGDVFYFFTFTVGESYYASLVVSVVVVGLVCVVVGDA
ncbi:MAG: hypothetical protein L3J43_11580 [Sulfurovum sp.]|nr:hypothetical protein [Sulfurovum sp.]